MYLGSEAKRRLPELALRSGGGRNTQANHTFSLLWLYLNFPSRRWKPFMRETMQKTAFRKANL